MKISVFKILRFQLRFQQHVYMTSCQPLDACSRRDKLVDCLSKGCQSVERLPQGCISVECLSQGSLVESDSHMKSRRESGESVWLCKTMSYRGNPGLFIPGETSLWNVCPIANP